MSRRGQLLLGWTFAALVLGLFLQLGLWQSRRAVEKQAMLDASAQVLGQRRPQPLDVATDPDRARQYDWVVGRGSFAARAPVLLDNQQRNGRVGVRVYRLFHPSSGSELLVDLGWVPLAGDRRMPAIPPPPVSDDALPLQVSGLLAPPPSPGLAFGPPMLQRDDVPEGSVPVWLATRIDLAAIDRAIGDDDRTLAPRVLRLDPALPIGHERDLELLANTLTPDKHRGYAVQWFGLALAVLVTALILTFRTFRR